MKYKCKECQKITKAPKDDWNSWIRCECGGQAYDMDRMEWTTTPSWNAK